MVTTPTVVIDVESESSSNQTVRWFERMNEDNYLAACIGCDQWHRLQRSRWKQPNVCAVAMGGAIQCAVDNYESSASRQR